MRVRNKSNDMTDEPAFLCSFKFRHHKYGGDKIDEEQLVPFNFHPEQGGIHRHHGGLESTLGSMHDSKQIILDEAKVNFKEGAMNQASKGFKFDLYSLYMTT